MAVVDALVALRLLTLLGWIVLVIGLSYAVATRGQDMEGGQRTAWLILVGMHGVIASTTLLVELASLVVAVAPRSHLATLVLEIYNPAYLLNATVAASVPFLILAALLGKPRGRRSAAAAGAVVIGLAAAMAISGVTDEWSTLMLASQVLSFVAIAGYLTLWAVVLLSELPGADGYLLGLLAVVTAFHVLQPIQAEFFEFVGFRDVDGVWHLHQFLQLTHALAEIAIVVAFLRRSRSHRVSARSRVSAGVE